MSAAEYRDTQSEAAFQAAVIDYAAMHGWLCLHTNDSRGEAEGEPDLRCFRSVDYVLAELKTATGRLRESQRRWIDRAALRMVHVHIWRPADWPVIEKVLG